VCVSGKKTKLNQTEIDFLGQNRTINRTELKNENRKALSHTTLTSHAEFRCMNLQILQTQTLFDYSFYQQ
jgi:hypothetical protein